MLKDKSYEYKRKRTKRMHWCKESKQNRQIWQHKHRVAVRNVLSVGEYENVPKYKASGGFLTW